MSSIFVLIVAVIWNVLWFVVLPLMIVKYLSRWPLIGGMFEKSGEFARSSIFNNENYVLITALIIFGSLSNYLITGTSTETDAKMVIDITTIRWSISYFIYMILSVISFTAVIYLFYKLQLFLAFFLGITLFNYGYPLSSVSNLFLWYVSYIILSVLAIFVGYYLKAYLTQPASTKMRGYFQKNEKMQPLELLLVNLFVYSNIAGLFFTDLHSKLNTEKYSAVDFKYVAIIAIMIASYMIYIKYRYYREDLPLPDIKINI